MTLAAAHGTLTTLLQGASIASVDKVVGYEDPSLYGQGRTTVTVSFANPVMDSIDYHLTVRVYASWANSYANAHAALLTAVQSVDDALTDTYERLTWETGANVEIACFVATATVNIGRDDF